MKNIIDKLYNEFDLSNNELKKLIDLTDREYLVEMAQKRREEYYGKKVFVRGLIEVSNFCKNNCYYCGIRAENTALARYRLTNEEILDCCKIGYELGLRTFVMQGGEDAGLDDAFVCKTVLGIKEKYPDCAVTLSLGEKS